MGTIPLAAPRIGTGYISCKPLPQEDELRYLVIRLRFLFSVIAVARKSMKKCNPWILNGFVSDCSAKSSFNSKKVRLGMW